MYKNKLDKQLEDLDYHYNQFKKTGHLYHLMGIFRMYEWLKQWFSLSNDDMIDLRIELANYFDEYGSLSLIKQLEKSLLNIKDSNWEIEIINNLINNLKYGKMKKNVII
jgi:hypothetical protein